jgi:hypothetical protein
MRKYLLLLVALGAAGAAAESNAPSSEATGGCVTARVDVLADAGNQSLYRIVFFNRCSETRSFFWCAENPGAIVPAAVTCPKGRGFPIEPKHAILQRKEFQWHLPRGSRIRVHDCPGQDVPTAEFGCAAAP